MRYSTIVFAVTVSATTSLAAHAQNITVQQPAFGRFSVGTTVSVPDRGSAFLGRVARAGEGRKSFGPFVRGSSVGLFREHSGVSAGVYIHDLREMDAYLLNQGRTTTGLSGRGTLTGGAGHAYRQLAGRRHQVATPRRTVSRSTNVTRSTRSSAPSVFDGSTRPCGVTTSDCVPSNGADSRWLGCTTAWPPNTDPRSRKPNLRAG